RPALVLPAVRVVPAPARKRVKVQNGTVVTHEGELLRGVFTSVTGPNYSKIAATKELGCNSLHIYPEAQSDKLPVGTRVAQVDKFVEITKALGMYLIITVGDSKFDEPFNTAFWNFYAPRYKDETHVIYEIQNEATAFGNTPAATRDKEINAYNLIRSIAPDTHIMFFSYSRFMSWDNVRTDLEYVNANCDVDWTNASVAWHGYGSDIVDIIDICQKIKDMGIPQMCTELPARMNNHAYPELLQMCEDMGISWNHFVLLDYVVSRPDYWKTEIEMGGVKWKSDFGSWPDVNSSTPFQGIDLGSYKASADVAGSPESGYQFSNGGYVAYNQATFGTGPALLDMVCSAESDGGYFEVRLDSLDGPLVGTLNIENTNGLDVSQSCTITDATGTRDLYFIYYGEGATVTSAIFVHTPRNPYVQINAADYDYQRGVDLGLADGGTCIGAIHKDDYIRFDNVDFGDGGITKFYARGSSPLTTYSIEVRLDSLDGPVLGKCPMPITGAWETYQTEVSDMGDTTGRHSLYLIFVDGDHGGGLGNLRWFYFE
ncbi:MAG: carbohydrate-binding protein, partial [Eubacteriales bacterium]|nr:carbohydrate-binding protein [Eubacteriales bacterium]